VDSPRPRHICPAELGKRMLNLGEYYYGEDRSPTKAVLAEREDLKKAKWGRDQKKSSYFIAAGMMHRDFLTIIEANIGSGLELQIFHGFGQLPEEVMLNCINRTNCTVVKGHTQGRYMDRVGRALFIAIPTTGKAGAGLTSMIDAMQSGTVFAITDTGEGLPDDFIGETKNGCKSGFRVPRGDIGAWKSLLGTLSTANASVMQEMESCAFRRADAFSQEGVVERFVGHACALRGMRR